ncbi:TPA: hypothetical protein ACY4SF_000630 [Clostridium perfringens]|uniref:hypothetical protein n=1 Tax=Clostridium perfringens TaxID=1502 RepID=UPI001CAF3BCA|nr:hypothetical protein [Clostridium perfringens]EJT5935635.1 hypothetical protein [Clostridium perfringens]ELC8402319.1 hypothetical protein [Clostridium perfringens]MDH5094915.1 hypothetical protein [Clostridium perfringens]MDM0883919.1 hypothetical protein [Clostridium perfringens]MDM1011136.1 hypothetical protein [Clostridium perfringens]
MKQENRVLLIFEDKFIIGDNISLIKDYMKDSFNVKITKWTIQGIPKVHRNKVKYLGTLLDYTNPITKNDNLIRLVKNQNNSQKIYRDSFVEIEKEKLRYKKKLYNESYKELVDGGIIKFVNKEIIDDMIYQSKLRGCLIG